MDIYDRINAMGGDALEVAENNIGGWTVTWPCSPNPIARHFTEADLEAGEFETWFGDIIKNAEASAETASEAETIEEPAVEDSKSDEADAGAGAGDGSQDEGTGADPD